MNEENITEKPIGKNDTIHNLEEQIEKAIAVAVVRKGADKEKMFDYLDELDELAETAGAEIIEKTYQELAKPNPATAIGAGKVEELKATIHDNDIHLVIFDDDLSPAQTKNLENEWGVKIVDRSGLILDIFAKHARTLEARTQVQLAQLQYLLPRLSKMWTHLSKQYGGIGTNMKGKGETQIETDRRLIKIRIQKLKDDLKEIAGQKELQRKNRVNIPKFALVGYTNAGKSTLMNALTDSGVYVEDKLFATLDTTIRSLTLPSGQKSVISDTVGFIRKLPHHLVASFRSTLSEAKDADVIVHVVDVSHKLFREHIQVVNETLTGLGITDKPTILVLNKVDKFEDKELLKSIEEDYPNSLPISAKKLHNITSLLDLMQAKYDENVKRTHILLPYTDMQKIAQIYDLCEILKRTDGDSGIELELKINKDKDQIFFHKFAEYVTD